jgi:hypothetical protein
MSPPMRRHRAITNDTTRADRRGSSVGNARMLSPIPIVKQRYGWLARLFKRDRWLEFKR